MNDIIEELTDIYACLSDGIAVADSSGAIVQWNRAMEILTGIDGETALTRPVEEIFGLLDVVSSHNDSGSPGSSFADFFKHKRNGKPLTADILIRTAPETVRPIRCTLITKSLHGKAVEFYIWSQLKTETENQAGNAACGKEIIMPPMKISDEILARSFRLAPISISVTTLYSGRFLDVNDEFLRNTGYLRSEVIGKTVDEIRLWEPAKLRENIVPVLEKGIPVKNFEACFRIKNGDLHNYIYSAEPVKLGNEDCLISIFFDITGKKMLEDALRLSEEKFCHSFQLAPVSISISTIDEGLFVEVNDEFLRNTGYSRHEVIGKTVADIRLWEPPEDRSKILPLLMAGKSVKNYETLFRLKDGRLHNYIYSVEPIQFEGKNCIISIFFDITETRRLEDALRVSEEKFSRSFRLAPISISVTTLEGGLFVEVNDEFLKNTGYSHDEVVGKTVFDIRLWEPYTERDKMLLFLRAGKSVKNKGICFRHKNGDLHNYIYSAEPILIDGENCIISIFFDVTEKKKLEDALKLSEEMYKTVFECTGSAMAIVRDYLLILVNNEMVSFTGYSREELEGKMSWLDFVLPEYVRDIQKYSVEIGECGTSTINRNEFKARDRNGNIKDVYCLMARGPNISEYVVTLIDMTEYNHLLNQINEISKREQQRIGELLHDNLIQYLTGISLIIRSLELRLQDGKNIGLKDIKKIHDLIGESLDMTKKLLKGLFLVEINYEGLPDALKNLALSVNELYDISCIFIDECSSVEIDVMKATELYYIANEAVHNAVKHGEADQIFITLKQEEGKTALEVRDNGKGFRKDSINTTGGLGLKLMRFRAKLIDAKIRIRNNPDGPGARIECKLQNN